MNEPTKKLPVVKDNFPWRAAYRMIKDPIAFVKKESIEAGDIYRIDAPIPFVIITGHEHIRHVLQTDWRKYKKGPAYNGFSLMIGNGILNSEGEKWKKQRKMIQPSFNREQIQNLTELMLSRSERLVQRWQSENQGEHQIEVKSEMIDFSLDIIGTVMMGEEDSNKYKDLLVPLLMKQYDFVMFQNRSFFKFPLWIPNKRHRSYFKTKNVLQELVFSIIDSKTTNSDDTLLSRMILARDQDGNGMSKLELHDEFLTLFATGFETTGSALSWALLLLASNPDKQEKLFESVTTLSQNGEPIVASLHQNAWLNAVVKETLRLYPSVWLIARKSIDVDVIDTMKIPKNAHVLLCTFMTHRDPKFWEDVEEFKPERFIEQNDHPSYLPFGIGARMCIGNHFSHLEMITALYTICSNFKLEITPETKLEIDPKITLQPKGKIMVQLIPRN